MKGQSLPVLDIEGDGDAEFLLVRGDNFGSLQKL